MATANFFRSRSEDLQYNRNVAWEKRHKGEPPRKCECGTILSRYNMSPICGPCRHKLG